MCVRARDFFACGLLCGADLASRRRCQANDARKECCEIFRSLERVATALDPRSNVVLGPMTIIYQRACVWHAFARDVPFCWFFTGSVS